MSADNWTVCPRCADRAKAESAERLQVAANAYGTVTPEEYGKLLAEAQMPVDLGDYQTFREDYEFYGAQTGMVTASYSGHCGTCGLGVDFRHEQRFYVSGQEPGGERT